MQLIVAKRGWTLDEASTPEELFDALRRGRIEVVVLDLSLRGRSGYDLLDQIRREHPNVPALILSSRPESQYALPSIRAGARGYIEKDASADEILTAIERVAAGRTWISDAVAGQMASALATPSDKAPHELLSPRELEVFHLLASGRSMTEIAAALQVSIKTASTYRTRILEKTGFRSNADVIAYAIRAGLV